MNVLEFCNLCISGRPWMVNEALDNGAPINGSDGIAPVCEALRYGSFTNLEVLLSRGASVRVVDDYGSTPLMIAVEKGLEWYVQRLLEIDSSPELLNFADKFGNTTLFLAKKRNIRSMLLSKGASLIPYTRKNKLTHDNII